MHPASIEQVTLEHTPALLGVARAVQSTYRRGAEWPDVVGLAHLGLCEAHRRFDPARGVSFWTFAYRRVRGAILDGASSHGGSRRALGRRIARARRVAEVAEPQHRELAERDVLDAERALDRSAAHSTCVALALELGDDEGDECDVRERIVRSDAPDVEQSFSEAELVARLHEKVRALPRLERVLIEGIYFEGRCLDDIGAELGISRSWACRIHLRALPMLRALLESPA